MLALWAHFDDESGRAEKLITRVIGSQEWPRRKDLFPAARKDQSGCLRGTHSSSPAIHNSQTAEVGCYESLYGTKKAGYGWPLIMPTETELAECRPLITSLRHALNGVLFGKAELIDLVLVGLLARGHILLEGLPGLGKTELV